MKDIEEIQESALLTFMSFIPTFPLARFVCLPTQPSHKKTQSDLPIGKSD